MHQTNPEEQVATLLKEESAHYFLIAEAGLTPTKAMSYAEYLAFERVSDRKHEYENGRVYARAAASPEHARLAAAISAALAVALRGRPCAPFSSDLRVRNVVTGRSTYPDLTVVCGALAHASGDPDAVTNPAVIVEVLSETTERDDRGDKWAHYQRIASLRKPSAGSVLRVARSCRSGARGAVGSPRVGPGDPRATAAEDRSALRGDDERRRA